MPDYGGVGGVSTHKHSGPSDGGALDPTATLVGASAIKLLHAWGGASAALDNTDLAAAAGIKLAQIGEIVKARLAADLASINGTEGILSVPVAANKNYRFYYMGSMSPAGGAIHYQIHALASATLVIAHGRDITNAGVAAEDFKTATGSSFGFSPAGIHTVVIAGVILGGAAADTIQIDLVDTIATDNVKAGSYLEAEVIP